jgi:hypothetical protein
MEGFYHVFHSVVHLALHSTRHGVDPLQHESLNLKVQGVIVNKEQNSSKDIIHICTAWIKIRAGRCDLFTFGMYTEHIFSRNGATGMINGHEKSLNPEFEAVS